MSGFLDAYLVENGGSVVTIGHRTQRLHRHQEDELAVLFTRLGKLLRTIQPADRTIHAQGEVGRMRVPLRRAGGF